MDWESQQHPSAPSTPNSFSSQSTGNSNPPRTEKIPTLKQISPSPSVTALSKLSDEDLRRKGKEDLLMMVRRMEADYKNLLGEHGNVVKDVNRRYQIFVLESRNLKEVNQKLQDDNQELRDLCCFLDDDRQRGRKLAREWQRFGRYTASVMRSEVAVYQEKLRELEQRQSELVTENMDLKELCLFLDQERTRITGDRDEGDGSSSGTTTGQEEGIVGNELNGSSITGSTSYLRDLELKVQKLEDEKRQLAQRISRNSAEGLDGSHLSANDTTLVQDTGQSSGTGDELLHGYGLSLSPDDKKPDAVVHAMKVLQVHEELEKVPMHDENWDDTEKAILREMCNVVWRKLGDIGGGDVGSFNESSDSILDPPPPTVGLAPGVHSQSQSFNLQQPQPQMASTPLATVSNTKMSSGHFMEPSALSLTSSTSATAATNQKLPESSQSSHFPPSIKPTQPQSSREPDYPNQNQIARKQSWPPQADQRVDMYLSGGKDQIVTANARPISPMKKPDTDRIIHEGHDRGGPHSNQHPHPSYPVTKPYQYSAPEDEKIPPHFLPHRRQVSPHQYPPQPQRQQRQPMSSVSSSKPTQPQIHNNPQSQMKPPSSSQYHPSTRNTPSSSSTSLPSTHHYTNTNPTTSSYNSSNMDPSNHNAHLLTSSQQYPPHHSIRLLDAPGVHQPPTSQNQSIRPVMSDNRPISKDDNYSSQKQKSTSHHPQIMYQRRDDSRSEPNISQSSAGRQAGMRAGGPPQAPSNQPTRGPSRAGMDRQQQDGGYVSSTTQNQYPHPHPHSHHGRYASDSSPSHQSMSSIPSSRPGNAPYQHQHDPQPPQMSSSHHGTDGGIGFSAYPPTSIAKPQHYQAGSRPPNQQQQHQASMQQKTPVMGRAGQQQPRWNGASGVPSRNPHYDDYDSDCL